MKIALTCIVIALLSSPFALFAQESIASGEKTMPGGTLAMASYVALWFLLLAYFLVMTVRLAGLSREIETLEKRIDTMFGDEG